MKSTQFYFLLLTFLPIFASMPVYSGILIEPYLGYGIVSGESQGDNESTSTIDYSMNAPMFGGKIGGTFAGAMVGVDYRRMSGEMEAEAQTTAAYQLLVPGVTTITSKYDTTIETIGLFGGYKLPFIKFWGQYFVSSRMKTTPKSPTTGSTAIYSGKGYSVGSGITIIPMLNINVEFTKVNLDKVEIGGTTTNLNNQDIDLNIISIFASIPFEF